MEKSALLWSPVQIIACVVVLHDSSWMFDVQWMLFIKMNFLREW